MAPEGFAFAARHINPGGSMRGWPLIALILFASCASPKTIDKSKFEPLYRASKNTFLG